MKKPNIKNYIDYRDFLKDYFLYKKSLNHHWSYTVWAQKLKIKSVSSLSMIVGKKRHLSDKLVPVFISYLNFTDEEQRYFKELIRLNRSNANMTVFFGQAKLKEESLQGPAALEVRELIFNPYCYALREMGNLQDFSFEDSWYQRRLKSKLKVNEIRKLKQRMIKEGVIDSKGRPLKSIGKTRPSLFQAKDFHWDLMDKSKSAIDIEQKERALHASTVSISAKEIEEAKAFIREFQVEFSKRFEKIPGDEVYQLNLQFFPITETEP